MARGLRLKYLQSILKMIRSAEKSGLTVEQILADTALEPAVLDDPYNTITHSQELRIYRNIVTHSEMDDIGLYLGWSTRPQDVGPLGYVQLACRTYDELITMAKAYRELTLDFFRWDFVRSGDEIIHRLFDHENLGEQRVFLFEYALGLLYRASVELVDQNIRPSCVRLSYPDPGYRNKYVALFGDNVLFDQKVTEFRLPGSYMDIELPRPDQLLKNTMEQLCQSMASRLHSDLILVDEIKNLLRQIEYKPPGLEVLAKDLNLSARSLRRHFQEQGATYRQVVDEVLQERALHYLVNTDMAIQDISDRCGFNELRSFYAAFKRWTGLAPVDYRSKHSA